jgi:hypothetical protein
MNRRERLAQLTAAVIRINAQPNELVVGGMNRADIVNLRTAMGDFAEGAAGFTRLNHLLNVAVEAAFLRIRDAETVSGTIFMCFETTDKGAAMARSAN